MSDLNTLTLDDINEKADAKFASVTIPLDEHRSVVLVNALQLEREERKRLREIQTDIDANEDGDIADGLEAAIRIAARGDSEGAELLLAKLGGNVAKLSVVVNHYSKVTEAGEA